MSETIRQSYARTAVANLQKVHGGEYAVIDFGAGPIKIIRGDGEDLTPEQAVTASAYRFGYKLFGADV
jgi:hypothetical protein